MSFFEKGFTGEIDFPHKIILLKSAIPFFSYTESQITSF